MLTSDRVRQFKARCYCEVGIREGKTTLRVAQIMARRSTIYLFDREHYVNLVAQRIASVRPDIKVVKCASSDKLGDSYCWPMMKLLEQKRPPAFDYVYLDGAHTWHIDALAFLLIDKMLKRGGIIEFDDYDWTLATSPTMRPQLSVLTSAMYTDEQIQTPHVKKIIDILVKKNQDYEQIEENRTYRKIGLK